MIESRVNLAVQALATMAPPTKTPRAAWIEGGLRALAAGGGPDAVRVETLAHSLGVTRGGFYAQFQDRGALLEAMLDTWEQAATDEVQEQVERRGGDARAKIRRAGALTFSDHLLPIDLAIRDWARHDAAVAARLRRVDNRRMQYLRELFGSFCTDEDEIEGRAVLAFSLAIGYHFIAADHGARSRRDALELAVRRLLA
ncbi:MAG TPA: TetR family transcriptional regulator [Solirubrobacteraceae bacterium]|nr:TetR family transcriptional regulator [Solirubrobacteraceae bacterium]